MGQAWNARQERTVRRIFEKPTRSDITWSEVKALIEGSGGTIENSKRGSGRRVRLGHRKARLHAPHAKELPKGAVEGLQDVLAELFEDELRKMGLRP